ncbi:MAG: tetratricopeptide repeat protein, partial [Magnetococcales bacterium]|nr:tetratricopeptide repeat protein [Magnetococcales bacterium]
AVDQAPERTDLHSLLLHALLHIADWRDFQNRYQRLIQSFHAKEQAASLFIFLTLPTTPAEQKKCAELFIRHKYPVQERLAATSYQTEPDRLKIGYLSFDYKNHPCGYVAAELFARHDRQQVEVIGYSYCPADDSATRQQIIASCDRFVDLHPLSHREAAQRIRDDGVHILVDLNGLTQGTRLEIAAWRPAPIQATWLGTATTVGAPFFDYCLTDYFMAPPGSEACFSEKLVRLPYYLHARRPVAQATPTRQACGLPQAGLVFVCFNQTYKINPPLFDLWMRLLHATAGAVLWLKACNRWAVENLRQAAKERGIEPTRLIFAPHWNEMAEHVARYRLADLALDTFPYTSGSTGWDVLSAGCPMVSCAGQTGMSRYAGSLLVQLGLADLVTESLEDYESLALALARDPARLAAVRRRLQETLPTARPFDAAQFARHLENGYKTMWQRFQAGKPAAHIAVAPVAGTDNPHPKQGVPVDTGSKKSAPAKKSAIGAAPSPASQELLMQEALQHHRSGRLKEAEALYQRILERQPNSADAMHLLGHLWHQQGDPRLAAEWIGKAVAANPKQPIFLHNLGIVWVGLGNTQQAIDCFQRVLALQPTHHEALYHLGNCLREQKKNKEAIDCYQKAVTLHPALFDAWNSMGNVLLAEGRKEEAIACYRKTVEIYPTHQNAYTNLANALAGQGETAEAIRCYQKALEIQPTLCEAHNGMGSTLQKEGKLEEAIACFQRVLAINPAYHSAYHNLGIALQSQGKLAEAFEYYQKVLTIQPNSPETYNNIGSVLVAQAKITEAMAYYQKALELNPRFYQAYGNIGIAHQKNEDLAQAIIYYQKAIDICPTDCSSLSNMGFALQLQGEVKKSIACYQRVLEIAPEDPESHGAVLHQMLQVCDWEGFQSRFEQMMAAFHAAGNREVNPFIFLSLPTTPEEQYTCSVLSANRKYAIQDHMAASRHYEPNPARLKIGYLSCDYQDHATTHLIAELFELHDRDRFEIIAYSYGQDDGQSMRRRVIAACDQFVDLRHFSHQDSARRILEDGVHILLELKGFTKDSRLEIPAFRPAPIQASWLGYPGTVGAPFIDYILTDPFVTPPGFESHFTEKIVRLDGCYQPNDRKRPVVPQTPSRQACGLPEQGFIFASFNKNYKINPPIFDVWMRLLQQVPESLLWLFESNQWVIDNLRREAERRGVSGSRLYFAPKLPPAQHIARYRLADLVLDTFPYTSHTTGSDALWAGSPLLTYVGQTFASRVAGSLLVNIGVPELITYSLAEYVARALELCRDPAQLAAIRRKLLDNLPTASLFDTPRFTRSLEAAYEAMWDRYQAGLAADHIDVKLDDPPVARRPAAPSPPPPPTPSSPPAKAPPLPPRAKAKSAAKPVAVGQLLSQARALQLKGKTAAAIPLYQQILASDPDHVEALYGSAVALGAQGAIEEGLAQLVKARRIAPNKPEMEPVIQPLILRAGELYNAHLKAQNMEQAARLIEALSHIVVHNVFVQEQAFLLYKKMERIEDQVRVAKILLKLNPAHFAAHQLLVEEAVARKDLQAELSYRIEMARRHPASIHTAFHLQDVYMALSALLINRLDDEKVALIEELLQLAQTIAADNPVAEGDPLYHSYRFYCASIDSINIKAVLAPPPPPAPWPALEFAAASGQRLDLAAVQAQAAQDKTEIIFYVAADPVYTAQHVRRYVTSLLKACEVPLLVIVQVIGGMGRLGTLAPLVGITDRRLIFAADDFKPESIQAVTWKINEKTPIRSPLVYYQSARFLWLGYLLEQFQLPLIVSDVDQLLQRGIREMLGRFAACDVVFHEGPRNIKIADHLVANLLLVKPTAIGKRFAQFFRYYMEWALQNAESKGSYGYFLDQNALLMARHHLLWTTKPHLGCFDTFDINVGMFKSYEENPFLFFSFYTGFDMESLPDSGREQAPSK